MLVVAPSGAASGPNLGDACIVLSLLFFSYSYIPSHKIMAHANATSLNLLANLIGGVSIALIGILLEREHFFAVDAEGLGLIAAYAFIFFTVAINLYFFAFTTVKAWVIASLLSLEVVFVLIMSSVWLHEKAEPVQLLGAVIVLAATVAINLQEKRTAG
jgi:drug/metabolite transporter (DMT)-like permease